MERKIGEIFELGSEWLQCVEQPKKYDKTVCALCAFQGNGNCELDRCSGTYRSDGKSVIFKKLEKVGEPYEFGKKLMQEYIIYAKPIIPDNFGHTYIRSRYDETISIEIKQTKENMEEYRMYDAKEDIPEFDKVVDECLFGEDKLNLKPFDIQKAREGKPVCTRDGRKARIICFDRDWDMHIVALVSDTLGESVHYYLSNGKVDFDKQNDEDLMMLPEKKKGWVNVYKGGKLDADYLYPSKEDAVENIFPPMKDKYIDTIKLTWEE